MTTTITKTHTRTVKKVNAASPKKEKETIEKVYRTDDTFVPSARNEICPEFMINFCSVNEERKAWLKTTAAQTITDKNGRVRPLPYMSLLALFVEEYFANLKPQEKGVSYHSIIAAL